MLAALCVAVLVEALVVAGLGAVYLVDAVGALLRGDGARTAGMALFLAVFGLGVGLLLAAAARGLWRGLRWGRAPVMTFQVLLVVVGLGWVTSRAAPGWVVALPVLAVLVAAALVSRPVTAATVDRSGPAD